MHFLPAPQKTKFASFYYDKMLEAIERMSFRSKMRKSFSGCIRLCLLIVFSTNTLFAGIGIKGGVSLSGLLSATGDFRHFLGYEIDWLSMGNLKGFQIGVFKTFDISKHFKFQPEIYYSVRGGDASETFLFERIKFKVRINYLEFPLLLKYEIPLKGRFMPGLFLGPYAALKLSAKKRTEIWGRKEATDLESVKSLDYGAVFGGGIEVHIGSGQLILEIRSSYGLKNIMLMPEGFIRLYDEKDFVRNFSFVIMTGYKFKS